MTAAKMETTDSRIPPDGVQIYIGQMLEELSAMAYASGLKELASLLRVTVAASQGDLTLESET